MKTKFSLELKDLLNEINNPSKKIERKKDIKKLYIHSSRLFKKKLSLITQKNNILTQEKEELNQKMELLKTDFNLLEKKIYQFQRSEEIRINSSFILEQLNFNLKKKFEILENTSQKEILKLKGIIDKNNFDLNFKSEKLGKMEVVFKERKLDKKFKEILDEVNFDVKNVIENSNYFPDVIKNQFLYKKSYINLQNHFKKELNVLIDDNKEKNLEQLEFLKNEKKLKNENQKLIADNNNYVELLSEFTKEFLKRKRFKKNLEFFNKIWDVYKLKKKTKKNKKVKIDENLVKELNNKISYLKNEICKIIYKNGELNKFFYQISEKDPIIKENYNKIFLDFKYKDNIFDNINEFINNLLEEKKDLDENSQELEKEDIEFENEKNHKEIKKNNTLEFENKIQEKKIELDFEIKYNRKIKDLESKLIIRNREILKLREDLMQKEDLVNKIKKENLTSSLDKIEIKLNNKKMLANKIEIKNNFNEKKMDLKLNEFFNKLKNILDNSFKNRNYNNFENILQDIFVILEKNKKVGNINFEEKEYNDFLSKIEEEIELLKKSGEIKNEEIFKNLKNYDLITLQNHYPIIFITKLIKENNFNKKKIKILKNMKKSSTLENDITKFLEYEKKIEILENNLIKINKEKTIVKNILEKEEKFEIFENAELKLKIEKIETEKENLKSELLLEKEDKLMFILELQNLKKELKEIHIELVKTDNIIIDYKNQIEKNKKIFNIFKKSKNDYIILLRKQIICFLKIFKDLENKFNIEFIIKILMEKKDNELFGEMLKYFERYFDKIKDGNSKLIDNFINYQKKIKNEEKFNQNKIKEIVLSIKKESDVLISVHNNENKYYVKKIKNLIKEKRKILDKLKNFENLSKENGEKIEKNKNEIKYLKEDIKNFMIKLKNKENEIHSLKIDLEKKENLKNEENVFLIDEDKNIDIKKMNDLVQDSVNVLEVFKNNMINC